MSLQLFQTNLPSLDLSTYSPLEISGLILPAFLGGWLAIKTLKVIWRNGLAYQLGFGVKWRPGTWAVVTGASDGIGLEYCRQLAEKGYKVLMIARNQKKLVEKAEWIKSLVHNCPELKTLAVDFSRTDIYPTIAASLASLDHIDVLVNNVGVFHSYPEYYHLYQEGYIDSLLNVNVVAITKMCQLIVPIMVKQKRGIIVNLSSMAALFPMPLMTAYSASKTYVDFLSRGLQAEYAKDGLVIQSVLPGSVKTNMSKTMVEISNDSRSVDVVVYVRQALRTVGVETRTFGCRQHAIQSNIFMALKGLIGEERFIRFSHGMFRMLRNNYYKSRNLKLD